MFGGFKCKDLELFLASLCNLVFDRHRSVCLEKALEIL